MDALVFVIREVLRYASSPFSASWLSVRIIIVLWFLQSIKRKSKRWWQRHLCPQRNSENSFSFLSVFSHPNLQTYLHKNWQLDVCRCTCQIYLLTLLCPPANLCLIFYSLWRFLCHSAKCSSLYETYDFNSLIVWYCHETVRYCIVYLALYFH